MYSAPHNRMMANFEELRIGCIISATKCFLLQCGDLDRCGSPTRATHAKCSSDTNATNHPRPLPAFLDTDCHQTRRQGVRFGPCRSDLVHVPVQLGAKEIRKTAAHWAHVELGAGAVAPPLSSRPPVAQSFSHSHSLLFSLLSSLVCLISAPLCLLNNAWGH